jgi:hypothetical protein
MLETTHGDDGSGCRLSIEGLTILKPCGHTVELSIKAISLSLDLCRSIVSKVVYAVEYA